MSWDVELQRDGVAVQLLRPHDEGANLPLEADMIERVISNKTNLDVATKPIIAACYTAEMTVTYNYSAFFRYALHPYGLKFLHGMIAEDTIFMLSTAIQKLGVEQDSDYWANTPGNAGHCLNTMLTWAREHPDAIWEVI